MPLTNKSYHQHLCSRHQTILYTIDAVLAGMIRT